MHWLALLAFATAGVFCLSVTPLRADSAGLGPGFHIGAKPVYCPAPSYQINAAVVFGGSAYFVAWSDSRVGSSDNVYGTRVAVDGAVLDPAGIALTNDAFSHQTPAVASDGARYFVVWKDTRNGANCDIYGTRVDSSGTVLDPDGIAVSLTPEGQADPAVAFGDTSYLVVWVDSRNGVANIYGTRVTAAGAVLDPSGIAICADPAGQVVPAVAFDGASWLVAWQDSRDGEPDIYGTRVATDGSVLDSSGIAIASLAEDQAYPAIASDGTTFLVTWQDKRGGSFLDIYGARLSADGAVLDSSGILISAAVNDQSLPAATFDGVNYLVVWDDFRGNGTYDIYATRIDPGGTVLDPAGIAVSRYASQEYAPAVAFSGSNFLTVWHDSRNSHKDIYGIRVGTDGTVLDLRQIPISTAAGSQSNPAMASDGTNYLAVWHEWRTDSVNDIFAVRVALDGAVLDSLGIAISTAAKDQIYPAVAAGTTGFLAVWQDYRNGNYDIYGARVAASGSLLDPTGIGVAVAAGAQEYPAVAFDGTNYFVVWQDRRGASYDIYGARVSLGGILQDATGIAVSTAVGDQLQPAVAFDGTNYVVVWQDNRSGTYDVYAARVAPNGTVLDAAGIAVSTAAGAQESPALAFDGTNYFAVWQDKRSGPYADIYGARLSKAGVLVDPSGIAISTASNEQTIPAVDFDGFKYLVVWEDKRHAATSPDIYGAKVDMAGTVLDPAGIAIARASFAQMAPAVCADPSGQMLVAYSSFTLPPIYGSYRIWANFFDSYAGVPGAARPGRPVLYQNFPNPFVGSTTLRFYLPESRRVSVAVYDVEGRLVSTLLDSSQGPGLHEIAWDGSSGRSGDSAGHRRAAPGIYFLQMRAGGPAQSRKMILLQ